MSSSPIYQAVANAVLQCAPLKYSGYNSKQDYYYPTHEDFHNAIHQALIDNGLFLAPAGPPIVLNQWEIKGRSSTQHAILINQPYLLCHESGEQIEIWGIGAGADFGEKGVYKALTGSWKYVVRTLFNLSYGEDAEGDGAAPVTPKASEAPASPSQAASGEPMVTKEQLLALKQAGEEELILGKGETLVSKLNEVSKKLFGCTPPDLTKAQADELYDHIKVPF